MLEKSWIKLTSMIFDSMNMRTTNLTITVLCIFLLVTFTNCHKKQLENRVIEPIELKADKSDSSNIETDFIEVENFPSFPSGDTELLEFINKNLNKKIVSSSKLKEGKVVVTFHIDSVGKLDSFRIIRSYNLTIDSEFLRVLKLMPNWKPGCRLINGTKGPWVKSSFDWIIHLKIPYKQESKIN